MVPAQCLSDLRMQIVGAAELDSRGHLRDLKAVSERGVRQSPIVGVVLTGGDLDQVLGLLHLRELEPIHIYATASIRRLLREQNIFFNMPTQQAWQSVWSDLVPGEGSRSQLRRNLPASWFAKLYRSVAVFRPTWAKNRRRM